MRRGDFILGSDVSAFEDEFAAFLNASHCLGLSNGTQALELALTAARIPKGSRVILPAFTFIATAAAVVHAGLRPLLVDCTETSLLIDPAAVSRAITAGVRAVIAVNLFGQAAPLLRLSQIAAESGLLLIEDAAQSHSATHFGHHMGHFSTAAATSFYPGKNLGAYGDAGAVITNSATIAANVRLLRDHGSARKNVHTVIGTNARMDVLQAIVLRAKLGHLLEWDRLRAKAAVTYDSLLGANERIRLPCTEPNNEHSWHLYVVRVPDRDRVFERMRRIAIGVGIHYPTPIHCQEAFRYLRRPAGSFPVAEAAAGQVLSLPLYPGITIDTQERVAAALIAALN